MSQVAANISEAEANRPENCITANSESTATRMRYVWPLHPLTPPDPKKQ